MIILELALDNVPNSWFALLGMIAMAIITFLFSGDKAFARDWFKSKERKENEQRERESTDISDLKIQVKELTNKLTAALQEVHNARIEIADLKGQLNLQTTIIERNERLLQGIKKYMEDSKQDSTLLSLLSKAS